MTKPWVWINILGLTVSSENQKPSIRKNTLVATSAIFGSRILGLVREKVFAYFFGAGLAYDAFLVAFRLPNLLRDLLAEGALSQSFITVFSQSLGRGEKKEAHRLANQVTSFIFVIVSILVILGITFAPFLVDALAPGFTGVKFDLTVKLCRVLFTFILFASLAAIYMGMLNAYNKFFIPQSASSFFNLTSILAGLGFVYFWAPTYFEAVLNGTSQTLPLTHPEGLITAIIAMAFGTLLGGLVQWLIQLPSLLKLGFRPQLITAWKDPHFLKVIKLTGPAILAGAAVQVNVLVNQHFASQMGDGAVSYLGYAFRLMQLPLGVFGVAVAIASGPTLAKLIAQDKTEEFLKTMQTSFRLSLFLTVPAAVGLFMLAIPIVGLIFEGGQFTSFDTLQTAAALMAYSLGISFYSLIKIYQPAYLAYHDAKTPMLISFFSIAINLAVNWTFVHVLHGPHWMLALGTSLVALVNFSLLAFFYRRKLKQVWDGTLILFVLKILIAAGLMGATLYFVTPKLSELFYFPGSIQQVVSVFSFILIGSVTYFLACVVLRVPTLKVFAKRFKK